MYCNFSLIFSSSTKTTAQFSNCIFQTVFFQTGDGDGEPTTAAGEDKVGSSVLKSSVILQGEVGPLSKLGQPRICSSSWPAGSTGQANPSFLLWTILMSQVSGEVCVPNFGQSAMPDRGAPQFTCRLHVWEFSGAEAEASRRVHARATRYHHWPDWHKPLF